MDAPASIFCITKSSTHSAGVCVTEGKIGPLCLLYVELLALNGPSVRQAGQCLADGPELLLPLLELSVVFKVCGGRQGESIPDPDHEGEQDQRHDPLGL